MGLQAELVAAHRERRARIEAKAYKKPKPQPAPVVFKPVFNAHADRFERSAPLRFQSHWTREQIGTFFIPLSTTKATHRTRVLGSDILSIACEYFGINVRDVLRDLRTARISQIRHMILVMMDKYTELSLSQIGLVMGNRHHTCVLHSNKRFAEMIQLPEWQRHWAHVHGYIAMNTFFSIPDHVHKEDFWEA